MGRVQRGGMVMAEFPGFPCNGYDFHFEQAGPALAGLLLRATSGGVISGVLPSRMALLSAGVGWTVVLAPFVVARGRAGGVLLGGSTEDMVLDIEPAPSANARIDVVYSLAADIGGGDPLRAAAVATGLAGAVPVKPSIPDGAVELGTVRTSAGTSGASQAVVTTTARFAGLAGSALQVRLLEHLAGYDVMDGIAAYCHENKSWYDRRGGAWERRLRVWTGQVSITPTAVNVPRAGHVDFPAGYFSEAPKVAVTPLTNGPQLVDVSTAGPTASGVDIMLARSSLVSTAVQVIAVGY